MLRTPPLTTPLPYTTLFRSTVASPHAAAPRAREDAPANSAPARPDITAETLAVALTYAIHPTTNPGQAGGLFAGASSDRKRTRLNSSHSQRSYAVFCLRCKR